MSFCVDQHRTIGIELAKQIFPARPSLDLAAMFFERLVESQLTLPGKMIVQRGALDAAADSCDRLCVALQSSRRPDPLQLGDCLRIGGRADLQHAHREGMILLINVPAGTCCQSVPFL